MTDQKPSRYHTPDPLESRKTSKAPFSISAEEDYSPIRIPLPTSAFPRPQSTISQVILSCKITPEGLIKKLRLLRRTIEVMTGTCAVINWVATVCGYVVAKWLNERGLAAITVEAGVALLSVVQIMLVVRYWILTCKHAEAVRISINIDKLPIPRLQQSDSKLTVCILECLFHAIFIYPWVNYRSDFALFGRPVGLSLNDSLFGLIVLRNYHSVRYLYWSSHLSGMRVRFFAHVWNVPSRYVFVLKCYLAEYAVTLISEVFIVMLVVSGFMHFVFERGMDENTWDHFWIVALTQSTIGYGDIVPNSFFGQLVILASCFVGVLLLGLINSFAASSFNLSPSENDMYYHLTHSITRQRHKAQAVILVQRWWRFITARIHKSPQGKLVVDLYFQLSTYHRIVVKSKSMHYLRLEKQVQALESDIRIRVAKMKAHLHPVLFSDALVSNTQSHQFLQRQIGIRSACQSVLDTIISSASRSVSRRNSLMCEGSETSCKSLRLLLPVGWNAARRRSNQKLAKAKTMAYLNVMSYSFRRSGSGIGNSPRPSRDVKDWSNIEY